MEPGFPITTSGMTVPEKTGQARGNDKIETGFTD
jgi:hypothetical protein